MSEKKTYDLAQVSQETKDSYLKAVVEYHTNVVTNPSFVSNALDQLCQEAEVKPKTAREILEGALKSVYFSSTYTSEDREFLIKSIRETLKVLP